MGRKEVAVTVSIWVIPLSVVINHIGRDPYMFLVASMEIVVANVWLIVCSMRYTTSLRSAVLQREFQELGSHDHHYTSACYVSCMSQKEIPIECIDLLCEIQAIILTSWRQNWELLVSFSPFFVVFLAFVGFILWNGSIVLGAESHNVSPHFAQVMYFGLVSALFTGTLFFAQVKLWICFGRSGGAGPSAFSWACWLLLPPSSVCTSSALPIPAVLLTINTILSISGGRSLTHWSIKYLLVLLYASSWFSIICRLNKTQRKIWVLLYFLATTAVLVHSPLIEFRYYTVPFYFFMLHSHVDSYQSLLLLAILYKVLNVFTMSMFLYEPLHWNHEPGVQSFIWWMCSRIT